FKVQADGITYDEMHVDGGIARQAFIYGPVLHLDEIRRALPPASRDRPAELYIIRNGDLDSRYLPVKSRALPILMTSLRALIHHQAQGDFYRMFLFAERDKFVFNLTGIPPEFQHRSSREFDHAEMERLFELGEQMGRRGSYWIHTPWDELNLSAEIPLP